MGKYNIEQTQKERVDLLSYILQTLVHNLMKCLIIFPLQSLQEQFHSYHAIADGQKMASFWPKKLSHWWKLNSNLGFRVTDI